MEYTQSRVTEIIKELEKDFGVSVDDLEVEPGIAEELKNCNGQDRYDQCSCCYGRKIILGFYDDIELKLISLFHELGHITWDTADYEDFSIKHDYRSFPIEIECTNIGLKLARSKGIYFSDHALSWMYAQAFSYLRDSDDKAISLTREMQKEFFERKIYGRYL